MRPRLVSTPFVVGALIAVTSGCGGPSTAEKSDPDPCKYDRSPVACTEQIERLQDQVRREREGR